MQALLAVAQLGADPPEAALTLDLAGLGLAGAERAEDAVTGEAFTPADRRMNVALHGRSLRMLQLRAE